jgi:hypothetical protein
VCEKDAVGEPVARRRRALLELRARQLPWPRQSSYADAVTAVPPKPQRHFHIEPVRSTRELVAAAPLAPKGKALQLAIELLGYRDGQMQVAVSRITGTTRRRSITQAKSLMFRSVEEVKDALDELADRLAVEAAALPPLPPKQDS